METKWIEDFLSVAETLNFSRSAQFRHVTQPAFCRRIRALETWLGAELFDRSVYPTRLTPAGEVFLVHAREMLEQTLLARAVLRGQSTDMQTTLTFAMPHTLMLTTFPQWLNEMEKSTGPLAVRLMASNIHDAVMALADGDCDVLMCYHHPYQSLALDTERYAMLRIGHETLRPYTRTDADGQPLHCLPGKPGKPVPFLCYSPSSSLSRAIEKLIDESGREPHLLRRCEADLAEGLKRMVLAGHGVAWLPGSAVTQELAEGQLTLALAPADAGQETPPWCGTMEVRAYRDSERQRPLLDRVWQHLSKTDVTRLA